MFLSELLPWTLGTGQATLNFYRSFFKKKFSAEKTTLQSQRQKLMNKSNVMERLGVSTTSGGKSPMTPGMNIF